jgi:Zn-finger nucleic acid-binding protein
LKLLLEKRSDPRAKDREGGGKAKMTTLNCPRCSQSMTTQTVQSATAPVVIDVCAVGCGGIWLDSDDMSSGLDVTDDLQQVKVTPSAAPDTTQPAPCPVCHQTMDRYRWNYTSPVTLDQCPEGHGTWIDAGEVEAMEAYEDRDVLTDAKRTELEGRLGMARAEGQTALNRGVGRTGNPFYDLLDRLWGRSL